MKSAPTAFLLLLALCAALPATAAQPTFPEKPIRLIVPYPPGGGNDIIGRAVAQRLTQTLGQSVVVDNRGGAATAIGAEIAAGAAADGYTVLLATVTTLAANPNLRSKLGYRLSEFDPVSRLASQPYVLVVTPSLPVKSVKELIAYAKSHPGKLNFASPGTGSNGQLAGELLKSMAGIDMVHVAFRGTGPALAALLGGQVQVMFATMPSAQRHIEAGKLRGLAVSTSERSAAMPDLPTVSEAGVPGYSIFSWNGLLVPHGTPHARTARLNHAVVDALRWPPLVQRLTALGFHPDPSSPEQFSAFIQRELAQYAKIVKAAHLTLK